MPKQRIVKSPGEEHLAFMCRTAFIISLVVICGWCVAFSLLHEWKLAYSDLILIVVAVICWVITEKSNFSVGLMLAQLVHIIYGIYFCLFFDIPGIDNPRTTHLYFLTIALVGYINYQRKNSLPQLIIILFCLATFSLFSSTNLVFSFAESLPHELRHFLPWVNGALSTAILAGGIVAMHADFSRRNEKIRSIQNAIYNNEFVIYYQPLLNSLGHISGAEALLRWNHPKKGMVLPAEFIPDAQGAGLMPSVGDWVIINAFRELADWRLDPKTSQLTLSINVTVDHLMKADFVQSLLNQAKIAQITPSLVKIELTESVFASDIETVVAKMTALANAGFRFSLDDFGTGFSSLSYLRRLPLEQIKIDRSFVFGARESMKGAVIARNIARMGLDLKLEVLAEGIETPEQWSLMKSFGCTAFQGFYFSRPLSIADFRDFTLKNTLNSAPAT
ncbi:putative bifunctional diguanylate cyclase/phosphodiesterase [Erwinia sp.]|uniref:putative bifunctional diguanylate cyclase/phosphodiesterase n=1 Tax=Erwinia citreus TaxID=558 RepID=UPI003C75F7B9